MVNLNRVILIGRLSNNPELKNPNSSLTSCRFTLAVDKRSKNPDEQPNWIPCTAFSNTADFMLKNVKKGYLISVEGRLNQRSFDRADGTRGNVIEVLVDNVQIILTKNDSKPEAEDDSGFVSDVVDQEPEANNVQAVDLDDEDLPF